MRINVITVAYRDKYAGPTQEMPLWGLMLAWLSRGDLTLEQSMAFGNLAFVSCDDTVCLGHKSYSVIQWVLGV